METTLAVLGDGGRYATRNMNSRVMPFEPLWIAPQIPGYRPCGTTYGSFSPDDLPPLPKRETSMHDWLSSLPNIRLSGKPLTNHTVDGIRSRREWSGFARSKLVDRSKAIGAPPPQDFLDFVFDVENVLRFRSPTGCHFTLPDRPIHDLCQPGAYFVRFLDDSQDCVHWYLYVEPDGQSSIAAAWGYDHWMETDLGVDIEDDQITEIEYASTDLASCASSIDEFLRRYWIENEIHFRLVTDDWTLTPEMNDYVNHYKNPA
ncbi:hypothetical protein [Planctomycetes bacterium K23_9]|uniref:Uncharacterized protein n=1 Tax=Stieleria marina TaxID=1930275 RepID=A0A517NV34_9BACT|nr:hypothetical protein K239x_29690 [Planctomycetes bacterium K23_9]